MKKPIEKAAKFSVQPVKFISNEALIQTNRMKIKSFLNSILFLMAGLLGGLLLSASAVRATGTTNYLQWSFASTSGTVAAPIADTSGFSAAHNANNIIGTGTAPTYSPDIPANKQFCTGVGSVSFTTAADTGLSTGPLGTATTTNAPTEAQIVAAGGLTMEVWVKNPATSTVTGNTSPAMGFQWAGEQILGVSTDGHIGYFDGDNGALTTWSTTSWTAGQWHHLAVVLSNPRNSDASLGNGSSSLFTNITSYLDGVPIASSVNFTINYRTRNISAGMHQGFDKTGAFSGLIYEPRMTLGALNPTNFTIFNPPTVAVSSPANGAVYSAPATVPLAVNLASNYYSISSVTYYTNGMSTGVSSATGPNYTANLAGLPVGSYAVTAVASYNSLSVTSTAVNITVNNQVSTPALSPAGGTHVGAQAVTISCGTTGATIYYTTDGSTPANTSAVYSTPIIVPVNTTEVIKAYATKGGYADSAVAAATYVTAATATFTNLAGGSWAVPGNWLNAVPGSDVGSTNYFNSLTLTANTTVTLDSSPVVGTVIFGDLGNTYAWNLNAGSGGTLTLATTTGKPVLEVDSETTTIAAPLSGTNGFVKTGAGTLVLGGTSTYTGNTTISAGTLQLNSGTGASGSLITLNDVNTGTNNTTLNINSGAVANAVTVANLGSGPAGISYVVSGGAQTYGSTATFTLNGVATLTTPNVSPGSYIQWTPPFAGSGTLAIANTVGRFIVNAAWPSFTGNLDIQSGAIFEPRGQLTSTIGNSVTVESGGELRIQFSPAAIDGLNGAGTVDSVSAAATLTVGKAGGSGNFSGTLENNSAALSFTKTGAGTQILTGANTYTGATTVSGGVLEVDSPGSLGSTAVTVTNATLTGSGTFGGTVTVNNGGALTGLGIYNGAVSVQSGGILAPGTNGAVGMLTINNALALNTGGTNVMRLTKTGGTPANDVVVTTGLLTYGGTLVVTNITTDATPLASGDTFVLFTPGSHTGSFGAVILPALGGTLTWDISQLASAGQIAVINYTLAPVLNPAPGGYLGAQTVTMTSEAGSTVFYTTDGSTPNSSSPHGTVGSGSASVNISVPASVLVQTYATNTGKGNSPTVSGTYNTYPTTMVPAWVATADGSWVNAANWSNNVVANGSGITADFSTVNMVGPITVTLNQTLTIGNLLFDDQSGNKNAWTLNPGGGSLTLSSTSGISVISNNVPTTINAALLGTNGLLKAGTDLLVATNGGNTYSGNTTISAGTLQLGAVSGQVTVNDGNTGTNNTGFIISSGSFANPVTVANQGSGVSTISYVSSANPYASTATFTLNRDTTLTAPNVANGGNLQWNPVLAGNGMLTLVNIGVGPTYGRFILNGTGCPNFTGDIDVQSTAIFEPRSALTSATGNSVTIESGGRMQMRFGSATTINALNGSGTAECLNSATTLTVGKANGSGNFSGVLQNNGAALSLTKAGTGTQILTGGNTYTGATTVSGGTLEVDSPGSLTGTLVSVQGGATLAGNGGYIFGTANINSGATLLVNPAVDPSATVGALTINGLGLNSGCTNFLRITKTGGTPASDQIAAGTGAALTFAGTLKVVDITSDATPLALGDSFTLFPGWSSRSGSFSSIILPALPFGLTWDTSLLASSGVITVGNVLASPTFNPAAGTYVGAQTVTISSVTPGTTIYYTTDGSTPTTGSASGITPVSVNVPVGASLLQIQAYAHQAGYTDSGVASATYSVPEAAAVWTNVLGVAWSDTSSWTNNVVPNNIGAPVDFSQLTLPNAVSVTLDSTITVGSLTFGDLGNSYTWTLADGGAGPLTLNNGTNKPAITVINQTATISANLVGGNGLQKLGAGTLALSGANTYSGGTAVSQGTLEVVNVNSADSDPITLGDANTGTNVVQVTLDANIANNIIVSTNGTGTATIAYTQTSGFQSPGILTLNRPTTINVLNETGGAELWGGIVGNVGMLTLNGPASGRINLEGQVIGGQYTFTGTVNLASGNLEIIAGGLGAANPVVMADGTFLYVGDGYNVGPTTIGSLTGTPAASVETRHDNGTYNNQLLSLGNDNGNGTFSGVITDGSVQLSLTKNGTGTQTLAGANTYTGSTVVSNGTLVVNGSLTSSALTVTAAGTLAGTGTLAGVVTVNGTLAPGTSGIGTLTVNSNLTLNAGSLTTLAINRAAGTGTYGNVQGVGTASLGGMLNVTSLGGTFQAGDSFTLIGATNYSGNFTATNLPALGGGKAWSWNPATGTLSVVATINTNPTNLMLTVSGHTLTLSWPSDHLGWKLQYQTNSLTKGLGTNWITISGSDTMTTTNLTVNPAEPAVFYRMVYP